MKKALFAIITASVIALPVFAAVESGLKPGERVTPFHPEHISGPLAGTTNCFPCTYQQRPAVQVWIHGDSHENMHSIVEGLAANMSTFKSKEFKALVVVIADSAAEKATLKTEIAKGCGVQAAETDCACKDVAIAVIDKDNAAIANYKINLDASVKNTVIVYKDWKVAKTMVNVKMDKKGTEALNQAVALVTK